MNIWMTSRDPAGAKQKDLVLVLFPLWLQNILTTVVRMIIVRLASVLKWFSLTGHEDLQAPRPRKLWDNYNYLGLQIPPAHMLLWEWSKYGHVNTYIHACVRKKKPSGICNEWSLSSFSMKQTLQAFKQRLKDEKIIRKKWISSLIAGNCQNCQ